TEVGERMSAGSPEGEPGQGSGAAEGSDAAVPRALQPGRQGSHAASQVSRKQAYGSVGCRVPMARTFGITSRASTGLVVQAARLLAGEPPAPRHRYHRFPAAASVGFVVSSIGVASQILAVPSMLPETILWPS